MIIFDMIGSLLTQKQKQEAQEVLTDYRKQNAKDFFRKYKKTFLKLWDESDFAEFLEDNKDFDLTASLLTMYLAEIKFLVQADWSGEEYPGQIKKFLHQRLKHYGYPDIKLNDKSAKDSLKNKQVKRGEWIPLLMRCFDKQVMPLGLKIVYLSLGDDEYNIALVPQDWFEIAKSQSVEGHFEISDTSVWEIEIAEIGIKRTAAMALLKKHFNVPLSEIKTFISVLPIFIGRGSEKEILRLKDEYERAGCVVRLSKCEE